jgi:hypothetical protein
MNNTKFANAKQAKEIYLYKKKSQCISWANIVFIPHSLCILCVSPVSASFTQ